MTRNFAAAHLSRSHTKLESVASLSLGTRRGFCIMMSILSLRLYFACAWKIPAGHGARIQRRNVTVTNLKLGKQPHTLRRPASAASTFKFRGLRLGVAEPPILVKPRPRRVLTYK